MVISQMLEDIRKTRTTVRISLLNTSKL